MRKITFTILLALILGNNLNSQWISSFGSIGEFDVNITNSKGNAITSDANGNAFVTGYSYEYPNGNDIVTIKYNSSGEIVWADGYNGTANSNDEGNGICLDSYGNVYVVGSSNNQSRNADLTIIKYNSSGVKQWDRIYGATSGNVEDKGLGIAVDSYGNIYVTGYTTNVDGYTDIVVQKYDSQGNWQWTVLEDGDSGLNGQGLNIKVSSSGYVYVAGFVSTESNGTDIFAASYDNNGYPVWKNTINGGGNSEDKAWGVVVDGTDNAYITGYTTENSQGTNTYTAKINTLGGIVWTAAYNGPANQGDKAWGLVVDTDGSVYITGETYTETEDLNYLTIKYSSTGSQAWYKTYNGPGNGIDAAGAICILTSYQTKTIVVTGKSWGVSETYDYATVRYNSGTGTQSQVSRYSMTGATDDIAKSVTTTQSKIIVTGYSMLISDANESFSVITTQSITFGETSELNSNGIIPENFALMQNYPNPFNPSTTIGFILPEASNVQLIVYDLLGRVVTVLINQHLEAGSHNISYSNSGLSSGVYFYELKAGSYRDIKKMNLIK